MTNGENSIYSVSPSPNVSLLPAAALPQRPQHRLLSPQHRRIRCTSFPNTRSTGVAANRETGRLPQHNRAPDCPAHGLSTQDNNKVLSDGDESDTMSVLLSISSILSLLTFLTTVLALVRVGTAAFASNQPFKQQAPGISMQPLRLQWAGDGMSLSKAMRLGMKDAREEERANGAELENGYLGAGAPLLRMSSVGMLSPSGRPREYSFISICCWLSYLAVLLQHPHIPE